MTFLEQLQQSAGLLGQQIQNVEPFGVYTPTESDYIQGVAQNRFVGNQFQMPNFGQSVHGGTQYTGMGTGTYTPGVFGSHYQSETGIPVGVTYPNGLINQGSGKGPMQMREDLHAVSKAMGWENLGTYQNPTYKDQGGDTFTFSKDLPYGQVYDQYGRKRTVDFEGFTGNLQGFLADPWGAIKQGLGIEGQETDPTTFESSYKSNYDPNIEGSGGFVRPIKGPPTTGDPKPGAPFGQPMGGNQNGGGGNFGGANVGSHNDGSKGGNKTGTARF